MKIRFLAPVAIVAFLAGAAMPTIAFERHPNMQHALHALLNAQRFLSTSQHDFHGLRVKALNETNEAIADTRAAIASDR